MGIAWVNIVEKEKNTVMAHTTQQVNQFDGPYPVQLDNNILQLPYVRTQARAW